MRSKEFKNKYFLGPDFIKCKPVWESKTIWIDRSYDNPITQIPANTSCNFKTPLEYSLGYWELTDPKSDYFWHPDLTADEYMKWIEHTMLELIIQQIEVSSEQ